MDLKLASKLIKYNPQDVQSTVYVVEYAQHNHNSAEDIANYIHEHLKSNAQYEIARTILAETALANTIKAKPSDASGKIDTIKEKPSTTGSTSPAMKSIEAKGDAKKVSFKGVPGTGTNIVQKEEATDWISDVVEELGDDFDLLTDEDLEDLIFEALEGLETEELLVEAVDVLAGTEVLMEAPSQHSAMPNVAVQAPKKAAASPKASRMQRLAGAARKVGSAVKAGAKTAAKGAVRGAGYASGLAQRAAGAAKREFSQGRQRGLSGSSSGGGGGGARTGGSSSSSSTGTTGSSSGGSTPTTTGGSRSGSSSGGGEKKPGLLSRAAGAIGRGIRKAVGAGAKVAGKAAVGGAKLAGKAAVGTAKGVGKVAAGTAKVAGKTAVGGAKLAGKAVGKTAQAAGSAVKATGKAAGNVAKATGRGIKKVAGKAARGVSNVSGSVASKLGEEQQMDSKVNRVRKMLAMQETFDHDRENAASWRDRLGWNLEEEKTPEQKRKSEVLKQTKALTNSGKHKEASDLFKKHFPNFGK